MVVDNTAMEWNSMTGHVIEFEGCAAAHWQYLAATSNLEVLRAAAEVARLP